MEITEGQTGLASDLADMDELPLDAIADAEADDTMRRVAPTDGTRLLVAASFNLMCAWEDVAAMRPQFSDPGADWAFGPGTDAHNVELGRERERREAVASGRRIEGGRGDWFASITWSREAWAALHGGR